MAELKGAAERGELVPHFQPKMELASGRVAGFEVLTCWQHPTRGLLPPGAFVPVAERTGVIRHLSRAVFSAAVQQRAKWSCYGSDLGIAVNLTAVDFISGMATTPQDRMIVRATIDLAHSFGLSVVAEGVETREVQALLRGFGCDVAQGFLYARPLPAPEVEASLASWGRVAA